MKLDRYDCVYVKYAYVGVNHEKEIKVLDKAVGTDYKV